MVEKAMKDKVWDKAKKISGKAPDLYRQGPYGNTLYKPSYGIGSSMSWDVDHIRPESKGGKTTFRNLQALSTGVNRSKGASLTKKSRHSKGNK